MIEHFLIDGVGQVTLEWIVENEKQVVKQYVIERDQKRYDLLSYVPEGFKVILGQRYLGPNNTEEPIQIINPYSAYCIAAALHEIGHAREFLDPDYDHKRYGLLNAKIIDDDRGLTLEMINEFMDEEYRPWEFSLQVLKTMQLSEEIMYKVYWKINLALNTHLALCLDRATLSIVALNASTTPAKIKEQILRKREEWMRRVIGNYDLPPEYYGSRSRGITVTI